MASQEHGTFNDFSGQPMSVDNNTSQSQSQPQSGNAAASDDNTSVPRPKRMACVVCRKRKLKCDGKKPSCGTCARVGHNCAYDEVRKKSGPKRGYVKQLEARLAQVETLIRNQESETQSAKRQPQPSISTTAANHVLQDPLSGLLDLSSVSNSSPFHNLPDPTNSFPSAFTSNDPNLNSDFSWEVISLGLEEPLPTKEVVDELNTIYFEKVHPSHPMIHRPRYYAAMDLAPNMRPPVCLRYSMWALAASITPKYSFLEDHLYARARKYIQLDEMKGHGEHMVTVAHCQAWLLISMYEFKQMLFPRAWVSVGRGARLASMMCLNRLDGVGLDVKHCIPPPRDWIEREERRRTFWVAFCYDRYASIGTGWPMMFDERDIMTNLPASEEAFLTGTAEVAPTMKTVLAGELTNLSPLGSVALMSCMFGLNLTHLHRPDSQDREYDVNGEFWKRHRAYDNILLNISLSLPNSLRLPRGISDPKIIFANMSIHTSTICLHQAAIFKAEKNKLQNQIAAESKRRCIIAADQVASIMRMISHTDLSMMNPFSAFCLYVAARVFVQYLKSRPDDQAVKSSLHFLLTALNALKQYSSLTESFLIQLDVDLAGTEFASTINNKMPRKQPDSGEASCIHIARLADPSVNSSNTDSPDSRGTSSNNNFGSLPSRQRGSNTNTSPGFDEGQTWPNSEMSDHTNPGSEKASPATMNSSSNAAITPPSLDNANNHSNNNNNTNVNNNRSSSNTQPNDEPMPTPDASAGAGPGDHLFNSLYNNLDPSKPILFDAATLNTGMDPTGMENPFAMNAGWSHPVEQPTGLPEDDARLELGEEIDAFSNRQFEQMLEGMGWNGWNQ